ncbi:MAG: TatD family hydrolase [Myxococcaceae bacterium]
MIDTHCHLDSSRFDEDRAAVLERAWEAGVSGIVIPAVGPDTWEALLAAPQRDPRLQVGLGIHPQLLPDLPEQDDVRHLETLDAMLSRGGSIAVGECGLDGPSVTRGASMERQLRVLEAHFELARKHSLPVLLHVFHAHGEAVELFKRVPFPEAGVLMHSYSGGAELVKFYSKLGCHFSLAGPVTYEKARKPLDSVRSIPPDRLMVETDAPDQAPVPHRGQRSEPSFLPRIVEAMARALDESPQSVTERTTANAQRFFKGAFNLR